MPRRKEEDKYYFDHAVLKAKIMRKHAYHLFNWNTNNHNFIARLLEIWVNPKSYYDAMSRGFVTPYSMDILTKMWFVLDDVRTKKV